MKKYRLYNPKYLQIDKFYRILKPLFIMPIFPIFLMISCANPLQPVDSEEEGRVKSELQDRSFRQFAPSIDALKRKSVILDFFHNTRQTIGLRAQYAEGGIALNEWEIRAKEYRVEKSASEYRLYFESPSSHQNLPNQCENCIETEGISLSIRNLYDNEKIEFRINDPDESLPIPFPIFNTWTKFSEDEYFD